jgi:hypothetical protein
MLSCWVNCAFCHQPHPVRRPLTPRSRYHALCWHCGAQLFFGVASLRWRYEPVPERSRPSI